MRILLTGASSFVGRHLLAQAQAKRHVAIALSRRPLGLEGEILWDLRSPLPPDIPACDVVAHLAAAVDFGTEFAPETYLVNVLSALHLARLAGERGVPLLFASMAGVHGAAEAAGPQAPLDLTTNYAVSKHLAEQAVAALCPRAAILRIGGIYGPGGPSHLGLNAAISRALESGEPPVLFGEGAGKRNYIWVEDMARWLLHLAENPPPQTGEPIYAAGPEVLSIREYLEAIVAELCPGRSLELRAGGAGRDSLVQASPAPVRLTPFREVLACYREGGRHGA